MVCIDTENLSELNINDAVSSFKKLAKHKRELELDIMSKSPMNHMFYWQYFSIYKN